MNTTRYNALLLCNYDCCRIGSALYRDVSGRLHNNLTEAVSQTAQALLELPPGFPDFLVKARKYIPPGYRMPLEQEYQAKIIPVLLQGSRRGCPDYFEEYQKSFTEVPVYNRGPSNPSSVKLHRDKASYGMRSAYQYDVRGN